MVKSLIFAFIAILILTRDAYAYLDPSAGSIVLQVLLGGVAGCYVILKMYWEKIKRFFRVDKNGSRPRSL